MNNDILLDFFYKLSTENLIFEKIKIENYWKEKSIKQKNTTLKETTLQKAIVPFKLENNKILLIEDFTINFFLSYTILIGENINLIEFQTKNEQTYICEEEVFTTIKNQFEIITQKNIKSQSLFKLKFKSNIDTPKIISEIKEYVLNQKHIDLNKIHIKKTGSIENFIPTIKNSHLKIAKEMSLPVVSLIENDFIKTTKINIYDSLTQTKLLNSLQTYEIKEVRTFDSELNQLYKDVSKEFYVKINTNELLIKLQNINKTNVDLKKIEKIISNTNKLRLTTQKGKIKAPLWKAQNSHQVFKIKNSNEFKELTGIEFENVKENLENIYLQTENGEIGNFQNKYLIKKLENTLETLKDENKILFSNNYEFLIKLIYSKNPTEIILEEKTNLKEIDKIKKNIFEIINYLVLEKTNSTTSKTENKLITQFLNSINQKLILLQKNYNQNYKKNKLVIETNKILNTILTSLTFYQNQFKFDPQALITIIMQIIKLTKIINENTSNEIKTQFNEFFKEEIIQNKTDTDYNEKILQLFEDINTILNLTKKHKLCILNKKKLDLKLPKLTILQSKPKSKKYIKPNYKKLNEIFKYSSKEIANQIKKLKPNNNLSTQTIKLKDKAIPLKEEFYTTIEIYNDYKIISQNEYFDLLLKR